MPSLGWGCWLGSSLNTLSLFCVVLGFARRFPVSSVCSVALKGISRWLRLLVLQHRGSHRAPGSYREWPSWGKCHTSPLHLRKHPLQSMMGPWAVACNAVQGCKACWLDIGGFVHIVQCGWLVAHAASRHCLRLNQLPSREPAVN